MDIHKFCAEDVIKNGTTFGFRPGTFYGEKAGWSYITLRGTPQEIGIQHGTFCADQIDAYIEFTKALVMATMGVTYESIKGDITALASGKLHNDIALEMNAIADGVNDVKSTSYDMWDIVVLNWFEGYTGYIFDPSKFYSSNCGQNGSGGSSGGLESMPIQTINPNIRPRRDHCSAFMATGPYTTDGKPVMFHNSFNVYETSSFANLMATIIPEKILPDGTRELDGHVFTMQTQFGYVHSMADYYVVKVGPHEEDRVAISETTIGGFNKVNPAGVPEFDRIRYAVQHFQSIGNPGQYTGKGNQDTNSFVGIMRSGVNGDYANAFLLIDYRDEAIWEYEEGLNYYSVSKIDPTDEKSYIISCNYPKDPRIKHLECSNDGGDDIRRHQGARRVRLPQLMEQYKGKIDLEIGQKIISDHYDVYLNRETGGNSRTVCSHYDEDAREFMSDPSRPKPYQPRGAIDSMGCDFELAKNLQLLARWGRSCGEEFDAEVFFERNPQFEDLKPFIINRPSQLPCIFGPLLDISAL